MNRFLLAIGGLLVGLLAILFAAPAMVDWNRYRGIFEEEASRLLGREVRVGGGINLRLLPIPFVRFEKVRIADATANVGRPLFMAEDLTVWLSVGGLLGGAFEATDVEITQPNVTLVLDDKGGGSWSSLNLSRNTRGGPPVRIAASAVRIANGSLSVLSSDGQSRAAFERINGELSAQDLDGPYKVAAAFSLAGADREIRLSTAKMQDDGSVRFKGTVRDPSSGASYSLDGLAKDLLKSVTATGDLTARLPPPAALIAAPSGKPGEPARAPRRPDGEFDVKAALKGDTSGFTLGDLTVSFEQEGRPQLATGSAAVKWAGRTEVKIDLKAHWLDLDRIVGAETGAAPTELMQGVASGLARVLATEGRTEAMIAIEQATLGGDAIGNLTAALLYEQGRLGVRNLSAALPGGVRLIANGAFEGQGAELRYAGQLVVRGASLTRFAGWAARDRGLPLPPRDGPFSLQGEFTVGPREIAGRSLLVEMARNVISGDVSWRAGTPQRIAVNLEGTEIDLTPLIGKSGDPAQQVRDLIAGLAGASGPAATNGVGAADAEVRLKADRLVLGATHATDATADLKIVNGNLAMPLLRLTSPQGFTVELRGDIADIARAQPRGVVTGLGTADTAAGVQALARAIGTPAELVPADDTARQLAPLRLAARIAVGVRGADTHDLAFDGIVARSRIAGSAKLGTGATWRERATDLALTLEGPGAVRLAGLGAGLSVGAYDDASPVAARASRMDLRGIGTPKGGLTALAAIENGALKSEYRGRLAIDDAGQPTLDGELDIATTDLAQAVALIGARPRPGLDGGLAGSFKVERTGARLKLASAGVQIAGATLSGALTSERTGDSERWQGTLKVDTASLPALTNFLASARTGASPRTTWSEAPFDLGPLDLVAGSQVRIEAARLVLAPGIEVSDARIDLAARTGGIEARLSEARVAGGRASGVVTLDKAPTGARVSSELTLTAGRLDMLVQPRPGMTTAAAGLVSGTLRAQSSALSPRGLIAALAGSGEIQLGQARLNRWTPAAVGLAAEAVLSQRGEVPPDALRGQLEAQMMAAGVGLGSPKIALTVADGWLRVAPLVVTAPLGRLTARAGLDLDQLTLEADLKLEPRNTPQPREATPRPELPAVTVGYAGPAAALGQLEPRIDLDALAREVAVRKVEREVLDLERIRREDEERARLDAERRETDRKETERRMSERLRLESLQQALPSPGLPADPAAASPISGPTIPQPGAGSAPAVTGATAPLGATEAAAAGTPPGAQLPTAGTVAAPGALVGPQATPSAQPAAAPSAQPTAPTPATKAARPRRDPFGSLREGSP